MVPGLDQKTVKQSILPQELAKTLSHFTQRELEKSPDDVVNSALRLIEGKGDVHKNIIMQMEKLPSNKEFTEQLEKEVVILQDDPELKYEMLKEIGMGGFARYLALPAMQKSPQARADACNSPRTSATSCRNEGTRTVLAMFSQSPEIRSYSMKSAHSSAVCAKMLPWANARSSA